MYSLVLIVCCAAIIIFFSQEFKRLFKKIFAIRGAKLVLPLAVASWFVFTYSDVVNEGLLAIQDKLNLMNNFLLMLFPTFSLTADLILIILLTMVSVGPVLLIHWYFMKKYYKPFPYPYLLSTLIWIICAFVLVSLPALSL